jgi:uncharacterized protein (TIGR03032 family)
VKKEFKSPQHEANLQIEDLVADTEEKPAPKRRSSTEAANADINAPTDALTPVAPIKEKVNITFSGGLAEFLQRQNIAFGFTSYQSGRLYLVGNSSKSRLALHEANFPKAMGIHANASRIYLGTLTDIVRLENVLLPDQRANELHDKVYVPRNAHTTGSVDIHELGIRPNGRIVFVNTAYNCLCEPSMTHSFKPLWKPSFISKIVREDRCHLNGLAMVDGEPGYVSAVCRSDVIDGWRDRRHDGGIIIDVRSDEIVAEGLSMPHSPRWYREKLWVLNSGTGELGWIDRQSKTFQPLAFLPGFLRGLSFHGDYAFVTLSKPRHGRFEGLELDAKLKDKGADAWCGVQIISLIDGSVAQWLRLDGPISELFDISVLPGVQNPITLGQQSAEIRSFITLDRPAWAEEAGTR